MSITKSKLYYAILGVGISASALAFALPMVESRSTQVRPEPYEYEYADRNPVGSPAEFRSQSEMLIERDDDMPTSGATVLPAARVFNSLDKMQEEIQALRGLVEEQQHKIQELTHQQQEGFQDLDKRVQQGKKPVAAEVASVSPAPTPVLAPTAPTAPAANTGDQETDYRKAYGLVLAKDYAGAMAGFQHFIKTYPNSTYVPAAYYWLGEVAIVQSNLTLATESFNHILAKYPEHPKAGDALLKLGYVAYSKNDSPKALQIFAEVMKRFPGTNAARLAENYERRIKQEGVIR